MLESQTILFIEDLFYTKMKTILVIGLYRSGTNYLQTLIENNLKVSKLTINTKTFNFPNKHAVCENQLYHYTPNLHLVLTYKNPYKWVDSLVRQSYDLVTEYELGYENGHTPLYITYDDNLLEFINKPKVKVSLEKVCNLYNKFFTFWHTKIHEYNHDIVYHNDLIQNPSAYINHISHKFQIPHKTKKHLEPDEVDGSRCFDSSVRDYYLDEFKTENLSDEQLDVIKRITAHAPNLRSLSEYRL